MWVIGLVKPFTVSEVVEKLWLFKYSFSWKLQFSPKEWPRCTKQYTEKCQVYDKAETNQVNALVYTVGYQAEDTLTFFCLSKADAKKYGIIKHKFEGHFVKWNKIYERAKGNNSQESQRMNWSHHSILLSHRALWLQDEMIRDCIVVGLHDTTLSQKL